MVQRQCLLATAMDPHHPLDEHLTQIIEDA
jgi:hypothetical protein